MGYLDGFKVTFNKLFDERVTTEYPFEKRPKPERFHGRCIVGSGNDHRILEEIGIRQADAFIALASGDNRNILAAQRAKHLFEVKTVVTRVKDPQRSEIFEQLGLRTFSPTTIGADLAHDALFGSPAATAGSEA